MEAAVGGDVLYASGTTLLPKNMCDLAADSRYEATCFEWFAPLAKFGRTTIVR